MYHNRFKTHCVFMALGLFFFLDVKQMSYSKKVMGSPTAFFVEFACFSCVYFFFYYYFYLYSGFLPQFTSISLNRESKLSVSL